MARSRKHKHPDHTHPQHLETAKHKPRRSAATVMAIFVGVLALVLTAFASNMNYWWIIVGTLSGAIAGTLIGHGIDKSIERK